MLLSLDEAATRMGKTVRQVRYMVKQGALPARKVDGRWCVEASDLPRSEKQQQAGERKRRQLRAAVDNAFDLPAEPGRSRYSVRDLKAIQIALPLYTTAHANLGAEHLATLALRQTIEHLARGCHRYDYDDKASAYRQARDAASQAVCELLLAGVDQSGDTEPLVATIEQDLMAALAGLLRRLDRKHKR